MKYDATIKNNVAGISLLTLKTVIKPIQNESLCLNKAAGIFA